MMPELPERHVAQGQKIMGLKRSVTRRFLKISSQKTAKASRQFERDYKKQLKILRSLGKTEIKSARIDAARSLRQQIKDIEKNVRAQEYQFIKQYRHDAAILKRQGLIARNTNVRGMVPSDRMSHLRKKFLRLLQGGEHAVKIKPSVMAKLKSEGFTIFRKKLILAKNLGVSSKGNIIIRKRGEMGISGVLRTINMSGDIEQQARDALAMLKDDEVLGLQVYGHKSTSLFLDDEDLIHQINYYKREGTIANLVAFKLGMKEEQKIYWRERGKQEEATKEAAEKRSLARHRAKYHAKRLIYKEGVAAGKASAKEKQEKVAYTKFIARAKKRDKKK